MKKFRDLLEREALQHQLYITEIRGTLDQVPTKLHDFFKYLLTQQWKNKNTDKDYMQTENLIKLQQQGTKLGSRFIPSFCRSTATKLAWKGEKDVIVKETDVKIFNKEREIGSITCKECRKERVVYARPNVIDENNTRRTGMEEICRYCKKVPYLCGFQLIPAEKHPYYNRAFVRENMCCGVEIQNHYYSELVEKYGFPLLCPFCGISEDMESKPSNVNGYKKRAKCEDCVTKLDSDECNGGIERMQYRKYMKQMSLSNIP